MTAQIPKKIVSLMHPTVVTTVSNRYLVVVGSENHDGWYPVKNTFTFADAQKRWVRRELIKEPTHTKNLVFEIPNSKSNGHYKVTLMNNMWSCDCAGFGFRRKCRHVDEAKTKVNIK